MPNTRHRPSRPAHSPRPKRLLALAALLTISGSFGLAPAAQAGPSLPRLVPTRVPASYVVASTDETTSPTDSEQFVSYSRDSSRTQAITTFSDPYEKKAWERDVKSFADAETKVLKVHGQKAYLIETGFKAHTLTWFEQGRLFNSYALNVEVATQRQAAEAIRLTSESKTSFAVKSTPRGLTMVFTGPVRALTSGYSLLTYISDPKGSRNRLYVEVRRADRRYQDLMYLNPIVGTSTPITIHGKSGFRSVSLAGGTTYWYEEEPGLLVLLSVDTLDDDAVVDVANSIMPTSESAWKALVQDGADFVANEGAPQDIVGAGVFSSQAWIAQAAAKSGCLVFTIALTPTQVCVKSPNSLGWTSVSVKDQSYVVGVTAANVTTVVLKNNGTDIARTAVSQAIGQPTLRLFVFSVPSNLTGQSNATTLSVSGLDATGTEVQAPVPART
jgi:hypothetical protein